MKLFYFLKILSTFSRKPREKFRRFWKYAFLWFGALDSGAPAKLVELLKINRKINGNLQFVKFFILVEGIFTGKSSFNKEKLRPG